MKIGHALHPRISNLETKLRLHRLLVERSRAAKWRLTVQWCGPIITGPFESLMGRSGCGNRFGTTDTVLDLPFKMGHKDMVGRINDLMLYTMCSYPGLASLDEDMPDRKPVACGDAIERLAAYERGRSKEPYNEQNKDARVIRDVRLVCSDKGVSLGAKLGYARITSSWDLFRIARKPAPVWNERFRLNTWLHRAESKLWELAMPKGEK